MNGNGHAPRVSLRTVRRATAEAVPIINRHSDEIGRLEGDLLRVAQRVKAHDAELGALRGHLDAHQTMTWRGRLRWLLRGV